jgi:hypothetical protein
MSDLKNYGDIFADLSQSAYNKRPNQFPLINEALK